MTSMRDIRLVATREMVQRSRSVVFRVTLVAMALIVAGGIIGLSFIGGGPEHVSVGLGGTVIPGLQADITSVADSIGEDASVMEFSSIEAAEGAVRDATVAVALIDSQTIVTNAGPTTTEIVILTTAVNVAGRRLVGEQLGLSDDQIAAIVQPVNLDSIELDVSDPDEDAKSVVAYASGLLLFVTIMMFGQFVAYGIVEEKQNRVVEVLLSRIDSTSMLMGKVIGIGLLGLLQVAVIVGSAVTAIAFGPSGGFSDVDLSVVGIPVFLSLLVWYILGFLMFSFVYAAFGATVARLEDLQSVAFVPVMLIMPAYLIVTISLGGNITTLTKVASFVPFWAPIVMPLRVVAGDAQPWEVAASIGLVLVTIWLIVGFASRVYRGAALRTSGKVKITEAFRSDSM
jgi:ABC-2 type transport system permease protein